MSNRYTYTGEEMCTRGEYGEMVQIMHRGFRDGDTFIGAADGPEVAVWDATFGWQYLGSYRTWADVLRPVDDQLGASYNGVQLMVEGAHGVCVIYQVIEWCGGWYLTRRTDGDKNAEFVSGPKPDQWTLSRHRDGVAFAPLPYNGQVAEFYYA